MYCFLRPDLTTFPGATRPIGRSSVGGVSPLFGEPLGAAQ